MELDDDARSVWDEEAARYMWDGYSKYSYRPKYDVAGLLSLALFQEHNDITSRVSLGALIAWLKNPDTAPYWSV